MHNWSSLWLGILTVPLAMVAAMAAGCAEATLPRGAAPSEAVTIAQDTVGDEIVVAGVRFHTGAPVVLWNDPGAYNAYAPLPPRDGRPPRSPGFGTRYVRGPGDTPLSPDAPVHIGTAQAQAIAARGWTLEELRGVVDQFVLHYDVAGASSACFRVLRARGLSVHFMIDLDGTIYQTLDVQERAFHATLSNDRSVGVEIANIGAYSPGKPSPLDTWYARDQGGARVALPGRLGDAGIRTPGPYRPRRPEPVVGEVQGERLAMYDLTPAQYESLARLTVALRRALPRIERLAPRDEHGAVVSRVLAPDAWREYSGILGHLHMQDNKIDPGPAFDWDALARRVRQLEAEAGR